MRGANHGGALMAWAACLVAGCPSPAADFDCTEDAQCTLDSVQGWCEINRWCSFPAADCPSGRRYGDQAGQGLAGQCVDAGGSTSTQAGPGSSETTSAPDPASSSTTTAPGATTSGSSSGAGTGSSSSSGETSGSSSSTGSIDEGFFDDFDRPDADELGNGWIERTPEVWRLENDQVVFTGQAQSYQNSIFYRPFEEARLDLEMSIEFEFVADVNSSTPQLHARIQEAPLSTPGSTTAYLAYLPAGDELVLRRVEDGSFALGQEFEVDPPLQVGERYRLTFRVTGTDPVVLFGSVEQLQGAAWIVVQTATLDDFDDTRIVEPGSFGSSGSFNIAFVYDNFSMSPL